MAALHCWNGRPPMSPSADGNGVDLSGKVVVVTGGTSGIGRALVRGLAAAGADVVPTSRRRDLVEEAAGEVEQAGRRTLRVVSDVMDARSIEAASAAVLDRFQRVDVLVNCAGIIKRQPTLEMDDADWRLILETNLMGTVRACRAFGRHMLERGAGRIINIASITSFVALQEVAAYGASKAAVASLTRSLAIEWGPRGVNVNAIAPGVFPTEINRNLIHGTPRGQELLMRTPLRRFGRADELAGAAVFLASDAASFVNGEIITVDGGLLASGVNQ
jgi:NAD(P)-dependent dehydrogenase (short-subunit alcohol dehydrogenase family)